MGFCTNLLLYLYIIEKIITHTLYYTLYNYNTLLFFHNLFADLLW